MSNIKSNYNSYCIVIQWKIYNCLIKYNRKKHEIESKHVAPLLDDLLYVPWGTETDEMRLLISAWVMIYEAFRDS